MDILRARDLANNFYSSFCLYVWCIYIIIPKLD